MLRVEAWCTRPVEEPPDISSHPVQEVEGMPAVAHPVIREFRMVLLVFRLRVLEGFLSVWGQMRSADLRVSCVLFLCPVSTHFPTVTILL